MKDYDQELGNSRNNSINKLIKTNNSNREVNKFFVKRKETIVNIKELKKEKEKNNENLNIITGNMDTNNELLKTENNNNQLKKNNFFSNNSNEINVIKVNSGIKRNEMEN